MAVPKWAVSADSLSATGLTGSAYAAPVQSTTRMATALAIVLFIECLLHSERAHCNPLKQFRGNKKGANFGRGRWPGGQDVGFQTGCLSA